MDVTTRIANIIEKRKYLAQKIEGVEGNLKTLSAALQQLEERRNYLSRQIGEKRKVARLKKISIHWRRSLSAS
ncbi:MAG: hypothetical protein KME54_29145 [Tolypothrix brevis GSE-NOS-MK-07-07A]|nr:hypothetical protein [Tolypothrix brevis GSE-NOS-MK-07-07A]